VIPLANSVVITGYVDDPSMVSRIIQIAEDFHPKVLNQISVGGRAAGAAIRQGDGSLAHQAAALGRRPVESQ